MKYLICFSFLACLLLLFACQRPTENVSESKTETISPPTINSAEDLKRRVTGSDADRRKNVNVKELSGRWVSTLLDVRMSSVKGIADSTAFISARTETFLDRLGIQQMEYWFRSNGSYNIIYRDRGDIIVRTFSGRWRLVGTTLELDEFSPKQQKTYYEFTAPFEEDYQARLRGVLDYDYDGEEDDKVIMILEKMSN